MHFLAMVYGERIFRTRWLALSLVALLLGGVGGCGGGGRTKILYVVGPGGASVALFTVSSAGVLTYEGSVSTGSTPDAIGIDPLLRFAYVVDSAGGIGAGAISQYVMNQKTGGLTTATFSSTNGAASPSTPVPTGVNPSAIALDASGNFVFIANQGSAAPSCTPTVLCQSSISAFSIDQIGGGLTEVKEQPPVTQNCMPDQITPCPLPTPGGVPSALATTGNMLFVAMTNAGAGCIATAGAGCIATYMFNPAPATQSVTQVPCPTGPGCLQSPPAFTISAGTNPVAMAMDSSGKFLFVADSVANTVEAFSIASSGQLTAVPGSPFAAGTTPVSVHVHPSGGFLYTANTGSSDVSAFSIDSSGALTALTGSPFSVLPGATPSYVLTDTSGSFLFVANLDSNNISVFSISSGALQQVTDSPFPAEVFNPAALATIN